MGPVGLEGAWGNPVNLINDVVDKGNCGGRLGK